MEFFIRQNSTEPVLKLEIINDGKHDKSTFNEKLLNSEITLDLYKNGIPYFLGLPCYVANKIKNIGFVSDENFIIHSFDSNTTKEKGRYEGIINIQFFNENMAKTDLLILPIREKLFINIV